MARVRSTLRDCLARTSTTAHPGEHQTVRSVHPTTGTKLATQQRLARYRYTSLDVDFITTVRTTPTTDDPKADRPLPARTAVYRGITCRRRRPTLLATFWSTLSDLDDDDEDTAEKEATPPATAVQPAEPPPRATEPNQPTPRPPSQGPPLPTPPPAPLPTAGYFIRPPLSMAMPPSTSGYYTGSTAVQSSPVPALPSPLTPPPSGSSVITGDVLWTIPWNQIRPGRCYRHQALGHRIVIKHQPDGSWYIRK
ncbi:leucine-rich repeat extensin-like protein 5 [Monomorium pharaonis]|uniref:leucine-rich repeat extensin-like protein 5 n=1 Tax=Monomorium pharaonis TaxID=307658 RepID=UPI00063EF3DF|nr:leucine-rich repeat extensin-like protein 5 [Monomorium pharaonis]